MSSSFHSRISTTTPRIPTLSTGTAFSLMNHKCVYQSLFKLFASSLTHSLACWVCIRQEIVTAAFYDTVISQFKAPHRWALTATPYPHLIEIMQLVWGELIPSPYDKALLSRFIRYRAVRDPPGDCLPVPALHVHMLPVSLTWQEMSVVHMHALSENLQATIRLASYFANIEDGNRSSGSSNQRLPEQQDVSRLGSLDDCVARHRIPQEQQLAVRHHSRSVFEPLQQVMLISVPCSLMVTSCTT